MQPETAVIDSIKYSREENQILNFDGSILPIPTKASNDGIC